MRRPAGTMNRMPLIKPARSSRQGDVPERACGKSVRKRQIAAGEQGKELVELALALPITLVVLTTLLQFSVYINNNLALENATSLAGQYLSVNRGNTSDPCGLAMTAFENTEQGLIPSKLTFSFNLNGTPYSNLNGSFSSSSPQCSAGAAQITQGATATMTVTYPCSLGIFGANLAPNCLLTAQVTEVIQ